MNDLFSLLTQSGYEVQTIGDKAFPCTLMWQGAPVAILMPDFSVRTVTGEESREAELRRLISFSLDNQGLEEVNGEYKLSQYQNVYLTATYDFEHKQPIYHIYRQDQGQFTMLDTSPNKDAAARAYAERSGLVDGPALREQERAAARRVQSFLQKIQTQGFSARASTGVHKFEIFDRTGKMVGYIGPDNRVTMTTDSAKTRQMLSDAYLDANAQAVPLPERINRFQTLLQNIGMSIRLFFDRSGSEYIVQQNGRTVSAMDEQGHLQPIEEPQSRTQEQADALTHAREEIRAAMEHAMQTHATQAQETVPVQPELQKEAVKVPAPVQEDKKQEPVHNQEQDTPPVQASENDGILFTPEELAALSSVLYANRENLGDLSPELLEKIEQGRQLTPQQAVDAPELAQPQQAVNTPDLTQPQQASTPPNQLEENEQQVAAQRHLTAQEEQARQAFMRDYALLQTMDGFQSPQQATLQEHMLRQFGTISLSEFNERLSHGDYARQPSLTQRLGRAQEAAVQHNNFRQQAREPQQKGAR